MGARRRADRLRLEPVASSGPPAELVLAAAAVALAIALLKPWGALAPGGGTPPRGRSAFASASIAGPSARTPAASGTAAVQSPGLGVPPPAGSTSPAPGSGALSEFSIPCLPTDGWRLVVLQRAPGGGDYRSWIVVSPIVATGPPRAELAVVRLGGGVIAVGACAPGAADASIDAVVGPAAPGANPARPVPLGPPGPAAVELYGAPAAFSSAPGPGWRAGRYDLGIVLSTGLDGWIAVDIAA